MIAALTSLSIKVCGNGETVMGASDLDDLLGGVEEVSLPPEEPKLIGQENLFFFSFSFPGESSGEGEVGSTGVADSAELVEP